MHESSTRDDCQVASDGPRQSSCSHHYYCTASRTIASADEPVVREARGTVPVTSVVDMVTIATGRGNHAGVEACAILSRDVDRPG